MVSIHRPLSYEPNAFPLRHRAVNVLYLLETFIDIEKYILHLINNFKP